MFHSKRLAMLLTIAVLLSSTVVLSGCRTFCADTDTSCRTGISPTFTVPVPPTATPFSGFTDPKSVVTGFFNVYGGPSSGMTQMSQLFSSAYKLKPETLACAFQNTKDTYGPPVSQDIKEPTVSGDTAEVAVSFVSPGRRGDMTFNTKKEAEGWKIDGITGWIGGDITPANPVGETQSCLGQ